MKRHLLAACAATLMTGAMAGNVFAADLYQPPIVEQPMVDFAPAPQPAPVDGWYLRGDIGYSYNSMRGAHYIITNGGNTNTFSHTDVDSSFLLGAGIGYDSGRNFRWDVTTDYMFDADFRGSTSGSCGVATACVSTDVSSVGVWSMMANAYVDFGTWGRFTPYLGGGFGAAKVSWDGLANTSCDASNPGSCDPTVYHGGYAEWRLAVAIMAGASIDLTCNLKADVGYRYRHITGGNMFKFASVGGAPAGGPGFDKGFDMHEGRAGLRYTFGTCEQPPVYIPPMEPPVYK